MLQLVNVHRSRGAVGGQRFCELLNGGNVESNGKSYVELVMDECNFLVALIDVVSRNSARNH